MRPFEAIFQPCTGQGLYAPYKTAESGLIRELLTLYVMTPERVYQRFRKKRITTVTRLEYDNRKYQHKGMLKRIQVQASRPRPWTKDSGFVLKNNQGPRPRETYVTLQSHDISNSVYVCQ